MKIDLSQIEGYSDMSAEEKLALLENFEFEDNKDALEKALADVERYKNANSKANSQIAEMKRQARDKLTEDEKAKLEQEEQIQQILDENKKLKKDKEISEHKAMYISLGYNEELADKTATALYEGDMATVFANQKTHLENTEKKLKADMLKGSPGIDVGGTGKTVKSKADFLALNTQEQLDFIKEHPNWKEELK